MPHQRFNSKSTLLWTASIAYRDILAIIYAPILIIANWAVYWQLLHHNYGAFT